MTEPVGDDDGTDGTCRWCGGSGSVLVALAYVPGIRPFDGPAETVSRTSRCAHCEGTGIYRSEDDPTLDWVRGLRGLRGL